MLPDGEGCPGAMAASPSTTRVVAVSGYCGSAEVDDFSVSPRCRCARRRPGGKIAGGTARDVREIQALGLEVTLARIPDPELDRPATTPAA